RALPCRHRAGGRRPRPRRRILPRGGGNLPGQHARARVGPIAVPPPEDAAEVHDPFVHLRVASGYSMRYGATHPADLVSRAAEHGMTALALTDRDGLYGAVKFALACRSAGVRPIFGVDLAVAPAPDTALPPPLAPAIGGASSGAFPPRMR